MTTEDTPAENKAINQTPLLEIAKQKAKNAKSDTETTTTNTTIKTQNQEKPSPILHAAIKATNGIIYVGFRHHNCFNTMLECKVTHIGAIQGFIDTNGKFHTREQALKIAQENNQIITKNYPLNKLLSEDLY